MNCFAFILAMLLGSAATASIHDHVNQLAEKYGTFNMDRPDRFGGRLLRFRDDDGIRRFCNVSSNWICEHEVIYGYSGPIRQTTIDRELKANAEEWYIQPVESGIVRWRGGSWKGHDRAFVSTNDQVLCLMQSDAAGVRVMNFYSASIATNFSALRPSAGSPPP